MFRTLIVAALLAAFVLYSASTVPSLPRASAQEAEATATATPIPTATPSPTPLPVEPQSPPIDLFEPPVVIESYGDALEVPFDEPAPTYYGEYVRPQRPTPEPVYSLAELQERIDALLTELPGQVGIAVLRPGEVVFLRDEGRPFRLASVAKVFILAAYLDRVALEQRPLDEWEYDLLDGMITYSDNDAAEYLWEVLGGSETMLAFLNGRGFYDFVPAEDGSWGGAADTPTEVAAFIAQLTGGTLLDPDNTALALTFLSQVTESQRWGVTAGIAASDPEAIILLKDGWYPEDDGWLVNTAGTVIPSSGAAPYALVILGEGFLYYDDGLEAVTEIATMTNGLLLRPGDENLAIAVDPVYTVTWEWLYP